MTSNWHHCIPGRFVRINKIVAIPLYTALSLYVPQFRTINVKPSHCYGNRQLSASHRSIILNSSKHMFCRYPRKLVVCCHDYSALFIGYKWQYIPFIDFHLTSYLYTVTSRFCQPSFLSTSGFSQHFFETQSFLP